MYILIDLDGVLVDFVGGIVREFGLGESTREYLARKFGTDRKCPWKLTELFPSLREEDLYSAFTVSFWEKLAPTAWFESLMQAVDYIAGERAYLCTSAGYLGGNESSYFANAAIGKERWIMRYLPGMARRTVFAYDKSPLLCCNVLIDDTDSNVEKCKRGILCPAPWNENYAIYWQGDEAVREYLLEQLRNTVRREQYYRNQSTDYEKYDPDYAVPVSEVLADVLYELGLTLGDVAYTLGVDSDMFSRIVSGEQRLTDELAGGLESVTGVPAKFWLRLDENFQKRSKTQWIIT